MIRIFVSCLLALFASAQSVCAFDLSGAKQNAILQLMRTYQLQRSIPLLAVSATINGSTVFAGTMNSSTGTLVANGENIRFRMGSVTKQFTAAGILALVEDGAIVPFTGKQIEIDESLNDFMTNIDSWNIGAPMTIRRLLTMTSNIPDFMSDPAAAQTATQPVLAYDMVERIKQFPLQGTPGAFAYSNSNYFLLGQIIQTVRNAGQPSTNPALQDYIRDRIFARAGMTSSNFIGESMPPDAVVAPPTRLNPEAFDQPDWPLGAGNLVSTAADMARWDVALFSGKVIGQGSLQTMFTPAAPVSTAQYSGCSYAMGWFVCQFAQVPGSVVYEHDGSISGYQTCNDIAKAAAGAWMSVTAMADTDSAADIYLLTRNILQIAAMP